MTPTPRRTALAVALAGLAHAGGIRVSHADPAPTETLTLEVAQDVQHESNLFRLPDGVDPFGDGRRDDLILASSARARFDRPVSLQRFVADITAIHHDYQEYDFLDFTGLNGLGRWDWAIGSRWQGSLAAAQSENLRSFADNTGLTRSINTYRRASADASFWLHPDWAIGAAAITASSRYSDDASAASEYDEDSVELRGSWRAASDSSLQLVVAELRGAYPNETGPSSGDYRQRDLQLRGNWRFSGISRLSGYIGFADREHDERPERDFSGGVGKLEYDWQATPTVGVNLMARREIGAEADLVDNFVVTEAFALRPTWQATPRLALSVQVEWLQRSYGGDPGFAVVSDVSKDDDTAIGTLKLGWMASDALYLGLSWQQEQRRSALADREYDDDIVALSVRFTW